MNGLALCAGIGGIELGIKLVCPAYTTVCYVEREAYNAACLVKRMEEGWLDKAPIWDDVRTFDGKPWCEKVDIVTAGFPCQPYSVAAHGKNTKDGILWPDIRDIIYECSPTSVFLENVGVKAYREPYNDLQTMGFKLSRPYAVTATELGAAHIRRRVFVYAYKNSKSSVQNNEKTFGCSTIYSSLWGKENLSKCLGVVDGFPNRLDRLRALGNAVVPVVAAKAFSELAKDIL